MMFDPANPEPFILEIHRKLCGIYHCPVPYFANRDPLSQLISSFLSQRTTNKNKSIAFKSLQSVFPTWEEVRDAPTGQVQEAIKAATWPEQKAPRLQAVLHEITKRIGKLSLDFLSDMTSEEGRAWLQILPGVGPKTAAAVMSFSNLRLKALPVDTHHYRVALRLGLFSPTVGEAKAHQVLESMLPDDWTAQDYFDHHEVMMFHGQKCCYFRKPACERCVLLDICPTGQAQHVLRKSPDYT